MSSTYIELPQSGGSSMSGVDSFNGRVGTVVSVSGDYSAAQITYSNIVSGIPAANVQAAIDYLANIANTSASPGFSFGRAGVVAAEYYKDISQYDADVYSGMILEFTFNNTSATSKTIGINMVFHEVV